MIHSAVRTLSWAPLVLLSAGAAVYCWQLPVRSMSLRVRAASQDQVRITWDRNSVPALLARSATLEIQDDGTVERLPLAAGQLRDGSVTYRRKSGEVLVRLLIETGERWAGTNDVSEIAGFHGATPAPAEMRALAAVFPTMPANPPAPGDEPPNPGPRGNADRTEPPRREAVIPQSLPAAFAEGPPVAMPAAPSLALPHLLPEQLAIAMPAPAIAPLRPAYSGARSGRIIWTGSMARRGVVEIQGSDASVGFLDGGLPGVPVAIRVSPAEFSSQGMLVHTSDAAANGRREAASEANGWNDTVFHWEPDRARELVVLEAPNPTNDYKRLVVRNDARACAVILIEWSVR